MPKSVHLLSSVPNYFDDKMTVGTYVLNFVENGKWCFIYLQLFSMMFIVHLYTILFKLNLYCKLCSKTISSVFTTGFTSTCFGLLMQATQTRSKICA